MLSVISTFDVEEEILRGGRAAGAGAIWFVPAVQVARRSPDQLEVAFSVGGAERVPRVDDVVEEFRPWREKSRIV